MPYVLFPPRIVNTTTGNRQSESDTAELHDGGYVVVWSSAGQDGYGYGIYLQRYDASGRALGGETRVNTVTDYSQVEPQIVGLDGGGYVVIWRTFIPGATTAEPVGIFAQQFDAGGLPVGGEFRVSNAGINQDLIPLDGGGYLATWVTTQGTVSSLNSQRYDSGGAPIGGSNVLASNMGLFFSAVEPSGDGLVATWRGFENGQAFTAVQAFNADGTSVGPLTKIFNEFEGIAAITELSGGGHVVVWGTETKLQFQILGVDGSPQGDVRTISEAEGGAPFLPAVAATIDGGFVIGWTVFGTGSGGGIFAQAFEADGTADGALTTIYASVVNEGRPPSVIATPTGGVSITYGVYNGISEDFEVYQARLQSTEAWIGGTRGDDQLVGTGDADQMYGASGDDTLNGGAGFDRLDGGAGVDTAIYSGVRRQYDANGAEVQGGPESGKDTLISIEQLQFVDGVLSFDVDGIPAQVMRLYDAALDRQPDQAGLEVQIQAISTGANTLAGLAQAFIASPEFQDRYGNLSDRDFVEQLYRFCLDREGDEAGIQVQVQALQGGLSRGQLLINFSESFEHRSLTQPTLSAGLWVPDAEALQIARLYDATFDRLPDAAGLAGQLAALDNGVTLLQLAANFAASAEFQARYGNLTDRAFVEQLYRFCLDREGDEPGIVAQVEALQSGLSRAQLLLNFSESAEHVALTAPLWSGGIRTVDAPLSGSPDNSDVGTTAGDPGAQTLVLAEAERAAKADQAQVLPQQPTDDIYVPADREPNPEEIDAFVLPVEGYDGWTSSQEPELDLTQAWPMGRDEHLSPAPRDHVLTLPHDMGHAGNGPWVKPGVDDWM